MEVIEALEPHRRNLYAGTVGYLDAAGDMDMAIAIRTAVLHGGSAYVQAGAGVVADSDPASEQAECENRPPPCCGPSRAASAAIRAGARRAGWLGAVTGAGCAVPALPVARSSSSSQPDGWDPARAPALSRRHAACTGDRLVPACARSPVGLRVSPWPPPPPRPPVVGGLLAAGLVRRRPRARDRPRARPSRTDRRQTSPASRRGRRPHAPRALLLLAGVLTGCAAGPGRLGSASERPSASGDGAAAALRARRSHDAPLGDRGLW
jgi:hypothetical protein